MTESPSITPAQGLLKLVLPIPAKELPIDAVADKAILTAENYPSSIGKPADSDDRAQLFQSDAAQHSNLIARM
ncbi:hypothetical protein [Bradyrhizobium sp. Rc2d]|uniref:hypothetical protein n=1 Tax=Bradyrhizobium sp. Rc2d TaxID=1855321 RepID=UPI000B830ABB|nr:hypothetical protein [Bradyrhizobium sp. Rc2d]